MARIRVITSVAGPDYSYLPGEVLEVTDQHARIWCEHGIAEPASAHTEAPKPAAKRAPAKKATARRSAPKK